MIVFATNNQHKLSEIRQIVGDRIDVRSLADIGWGGEWSQKYHQIVQHGLAVAFLCGEFVHAYHESGHG